jgi:hypothetical protein
VATGECRSLPAPVFDLHCGGSRWSIRLLACAGDGAWAQPAATPQPERVEAIVRARP